MGAKKLSYSFYESASENWRLIKNSDNENPSGKAKVKLDYSPFGMMLPGRNGGDDYRFGFQGQECDPEIKGEGNSINFTYRMHDPRIGRFFALDPLAFKYPYYSPYAFSGNRVIDAFEIEGLEPQSIHVIMTDKNGALVYEYKYKAKTGVITNDDLKETKLSLYGVDVNNYEINSSVLIYINVDDRTIEKTYVHSYEPPIVIAQKTSELEDNEPCTFCTGGAGPIGGIIKFFSEEGYQDFKTWDASFFDTEQGMYQGLKFGASVVTAIFTGGSSLSFTSGFGFVMAMNQITAGLDGQGPITELITMTFGETAAQGVEIVGMFFDISGAADNIITATIAFSDGQTAIGVYNTIEGAWTSYGVVETATEVTNGSTENTTTTGN